MTDKAKAITAAAQFALFRKKDAVEFDESGIMTSAEPSSIEMEGGANAVAAGMLDGANHEVVFAGAGFSLARVWFKSGFPLPRHSHDGACLYYITAGSLKMGAEILGPGEGFFVGPDVPYAYRPGPDGVELLEFRAADSFGIKMLANNAAFWEKAAADVAQLAPKWAKEPRPSEKA